MAIFLNAFHAGSHRRKADLAHPEPSEVRAVTLRGYANPQKANAIAAQGPRHKRMAKHIRV